MRVDKELAFLKLVAIVAALYYAYRLSQKSGGQISNQNLQVNPDKLVNLGAQLFSPELRPYAKKYGAEIVKRLMT